MLSKVINKNMKYITEPFRCIYIICIPRKYAIYYNITCGINVRKTEKLILARISYSKLMSTKL